MRPSPTATPDRAPSLPLPPPPPRPSQDYELPAGCQRAIVIGKHLCGPGTDAAIEFVAARLPRVLGCVFATVGGPPGAAKRPQRFPQ
jgi:hypothetical protein